MDGDLIYDVGMNNGDDTAYYLSKGYRVVAIDADPYLIELGRNRFKNEIECGRVTLLNVAIAPEEGTAKLWVSPTMRIWNSLDRETATRQGREAYEIEVPARKFRGILEEFGTPYYLKIDIEGCDYYCLLDLQRDDLPRYTSVELARVEWLSQMRRAGYDQFKMIDQRRFTPVEYDPYGLPVLRYAQERFKERRLLGKALRLPGRIGRKLGLVREQDAPKPGPYAPDSSGPFGEDLAGRWLTFDELLFTWMAMDLGYTASGPRRLGTWFDIHATRSDWPASAGGSGTISCNKSNSLLGDSEPGAGSRRLPEKSFRRRPASCHRSF